MAKLYLQWYLWASVQSGMSMKTFFLKLDLFALWCNLEYLQICRMTHIWKIARFRKKHYQRKYYFKYDDNGSRHNWLLRKLRGTIVNIIWPPQVLFHCREFYFNAASFISLPRVLFYCREFCFTAASFVLPPQVLFSPPRVLFYCREFYFLRREY